VAAFGPERNPAVGARDQARHAQAAARAKQADHVVLFRFSAADLTQIARGQTGQGLRERGEVVHHHERFEAQPLAHFLDGKAPGIVGHLHLVAFDRVRDGHTRVQHFGVRHRLQIRGDRRMKIRELIAAQRGDVGEFALRRFERETRVSAADVGDEPGIVEGSHGRGSIAQTAMPVIRARSARDARAKRWRRWVPSSLLHKVWGACQYCASPR
jgi:hypothetical protein